MIIIDIRIAFFDLDGTLLSADHETITASTQLALVKIKEAGIIPAIATGRSRAHLPECLKSLPFEYLITSNGAHVRDIKNKSHLYTDYLSAEDAAIAWQILKPRELFVEWYTGNEVGIDAATFARLDSLTMPKWHTDYFAKGKMPVFETTEHYIADGANELEKINLPRFDPQVLSLVRQELEDTNRFTLSSSYGRNIEINKKGCTKGKAIKALCAKLGLSPAQAMAFGDGNNDVEMLKTVGLSVAMANGVEAAKNAAQYIAESYDRDGVALFIEDMLLQERKNA